MMIRARSWTCSGACLASLLSSAFLLPAQQFPPKLRQALATQLKFTETDLAAAEAGRPVARIVETDDPEDVFVVGVIRIATTPAIFLKRYRDITSFESSSSILAGSKFSVPPKLSDVADAKLTASEVDDLHECEPGDCDFKIGKIGLQRIQSSVNWESSDYVAQANNAIRRLWIEYLNNYQMQGNAALAVYHDTEKVFRVERGLVDLLQKSPLLRQAIPELVDYLLHYPKAKLPRSEEFFYWQQADFGLKAIHRITHVVMQQVPVETGTAAVIASKMLFASHYFRSALEFRFLCPVSAGGKPATYLVVAQRSYVDGLGGFKGRLIRGPIMSKTQDSLEQYLLSVKGKLEAGHQN